MAIPASSKADDGRLERAESAARRAEQALARAEQRLEEARQEAVQALDADQIRGIIVIDEKEYVELYIKPEKTQLNDANAAAEKASAELEAARAAAAEARAERMSHRYESYG